MAERSSTGDSGGDEREVDNAPLWKYVIKLEKLKGGGGNWKFECKYCHEVFQGSYSRIKAHLMREKGHGIRACNAVKQDHLNSMKQLIDQAAATKVQSGSKSIPLSSSSSLCQTETKKRRGPGMIETAFNKAVRDELDEMIARMFYSSGLPFNLARNPYYAKSYTHASTHSISGYKPPGYNMLRTTLLQNERSHIEKMLMPIKDTWRSKGVSIVSDGWSDAQRRPLINIMTVNESGSMFLKAINAEGQTKNRHFISDLLLKAIEEVGPYNVVQIITDNAAVCKAAGAIVKDNYPLIFWTPCVVHALNLAVKNICAAKNTEANEITYEECGWISEVSAEVMEIKNFIMNHSMRLSMFNDHVKLKLLSIAKTRFASMIIMIRRFKTIKRGLQDMVISEHWSVYREDDVVRAQAVKEKILNDMWWDKIEYIISFTEPIYEMLRIADTDKLTLHLIYDMWDTMIEKVKNAIYRHEGKRDDEESDFYEAVHTILVDRWNKSSTPLHCLAHSLNPRYYNSEWLAENINRKPPHRDNEISTESIKCLKRYYSDVEARRCINIEFAKFSSAKDDFSDSDRLRNRVYMDPKDWWNAYGASTPNLQALAEKLLGQPCSSSCCERNWSTYSFIHSLKRNKLTPERAEDLVFIHTNLRLLSRSSKEYYQGQSKLWDLGGDAFESFEGAGILEVANLSLDEPELEAVLFEDESHENNDAMDTL